MNFKQFVESNIPYDRDVDDFCWMRLGYGAEQLARRVEANQDKAVQSEEAYTIYRLGKSHYLYRVVEIGTMPGIKIDSIWDEREED